MTDETPKTPKIEAGVPCPYDGDDRDGAFVEVGFRDRFVRTLKSRVDYPDRRWNPEAERWWVAGEHVDDVLDLVRDVFGGYQITDPDGATRYVDGAGEFEQEDLFG